MSNKKALVLLSGGLDSTIVLGLLKKQGVEVEAIHFTSLFCTCGGKEGGCGAALKAAKQLGVKLHVVKKGDDYLELIKKPAHGYGSNVNPCIDCRIYSFKKAKELMEAIGASFIVTGEVLGQRPMSQRLEAMKVIEKEAGMEGLVVRPLSAQHLELSIPEKEGWVNRAEFLGIKGRGRKEQMRVAAELNITDYPCPAGGCLLTDPGFAKRVKDLLAGKKKILPGDFMLLKYGRHFRLDERVKLVVGRNEPENKILETLRKESEVLLWPADVPGPHSLLLGDLAGEDIIFSAAVTARFSDVKDRTQKVKILYKAQDGVEKEIIVLSAKEEEYITMRI
ncbi:MAG: 7-cyano-7-deazaguanine synthase [Candidatus Firestonebacteria bacterium]